MLYEEATKAKVPVSLATVYNTLHQFTEVGLLRQVAVDGSKTYFDTNESEHHHFFIEGENELLDIPACRRGGRQDADPAGRLRDRAHRRGGAAAPQEVVAIPNLPEFTIGPADCGPDPLAAILNDKIYSTFSSG